MNTGLRKPSALRTPAALPAKPLLTVLQPTKQATAIPAQSGLLPPSNAVVKQSKLKPLATTTARATTTIPSRLPAAVAPASKLLAPAATITSIPSFKPLPSFSTLSTPPSTAASPAVSPAPAPAVAVLPVAASVPAPLEATPLLAVAPTAEEDDIAAILAAEEAQSLPACFIDGEASSAKATAAVATAPSPQRFEPGATVDTTDAVETFTIRRSPSPAASIDDEEEAARQEEEDGFGQFTIPESDPSETEAVAMPMERPPMQLPPIRPFVAAVFPYELDTSAEAIARRSVQITAAEARLAILRSEIDLYACKMARILELAAEGKYMKHRFIRDLVHTIETSDGVPVEIANDGGD
jgi:hypothetical protein